MTKSSTGRSKTKNAITKALASRNNATVLPSGTLVNPVKVHLWGSGMISNHTRQRGAANLSPVMQLSQDLYSAAAELLRVIKEEMLAS